MTNLLFRLAHHHSQVAHSVSQYLGRLNHLADQDTYWYLSAVPDLMAPAAGQFEAFLPQAEAEDA